MKLKAGDSALGPKGVPHAFAFAGSGTGRILILYAPAGRMEAYFDLKEKAPGGFASYKPNPERMRAYGPRTRWTAAGRFLTLTPVASTPRTSLAGSAGPR